MQTNQANTKSKRSLNKLLFAICSLSLALTACSGATTSIGAGGGSYGGGGGVAISFPVGDASSSNTGSSTVNNNANTAENSTTNTNSGAYIGSNLFKPYPKNDCYEPMKPDRGDSAGSYMLYKQQLDTYRMCIDTYVKNAKNDMQDIEAKANSALRQYQLFVTRP